MAPATRSHQAARSNADRPAQSGQALAAARTASSTSPGPATATEAKVSPVAGLVAGSGAVRPGRH